MNERMRESLSALMDGEANELELERLLANVDDAELRATWVRYNLARTVAGSVGQELGSAPPVDFGSRIRAALEGEAGRAPGAAPSPVKRLLRPLASMAVAASVAMVVVFGGQQLQQGGAGEPGSGGLPHGVSPVGMVNSIGATPVRASFGTQPLPVVQPSTGSAYRELARQQMERYLRQHAEQAALNSPHGLVPFVRARKVEE
jgi:sigma-E factor negative regulatory protein RseA